MRSSGFLDPECLDPVLATGGCLVGVSGGADSVALLHAILRWSETREPRIRIEAVHVNHGLRGGESDQDAVFVEELCMRWQVPFHLRATEPVTARERGMSVEEFLRIQRHRCFDEVLESTGLRVLATAHSADDLAETLLMHLMRGAGLRGLVFREVEPRGAGWLVRPLGKRTREEILGYLTEHGLRHREDSSNSSPEFTRNRVRRVLLPLMEREFNPSVREALQRSGTLLTEAGEYLRKIVTEQTRMVMEESGDRLRMPVRSLLGRDRFLQKEILLEWIRRATGERLRPGFRQTEQILQIAALGHGRVDLAEGAGVVSGGGFLVLLLTGAGTPEDSGFAGPRSRDPDPAAEELARQYLQEHPGLPLARLGVEGIRVDFRPGGEPEKGQLVLLDGSTLMVELRFPESEVLRERAHFEIRNRRPGDYLSDSVKLKECLINDKVAWFLRDFLVLLADRSGRVFHVFGVNRINARIAKKFGTALPVLVSSHSSKSREL